MYQLFLSNTEKGLIHSKWSSVKQTKFIVSNIDNKKGTGSLKNGGGDTIYET